MHTLFDNLWNLQELCAKQNTDSSIVQRGYFRHFVLSIRQPHPTIKKPFPSTNQTNLRQIRRIPSMFFGKNWEKVSRFWRICFSPSLFWQIRQFSVKSRFWFASLASIRIRQGKSTDPFFFQNHPICQYLCQSRKYHL